MSKHSLKLDQDELFILENKLMASTENLEIENTFLEYCNRRALNSLISSSLFKISEDDQYVAPHLTGKLSLKIVNTDKLNLSVQIYLPNKQNDNSINILKKASKDSKKTVWTGNTYSGISNYTIWTGNYQILYVTAGSCKVRILEVPKDIDINEFKSNISFSVIEERILNRGDSVANWNKNSIIEILDVYETLVISTLTINNPEVELHWTFNTYSKSVSAAPSKLYLIRLITFISLALEMEVNIPDLLYNFIFNLGDPLIKFKAIEAMLLEDHPLAIEKLQSAINSSNPILSNLATNLANKIFASQN